MIANSVDALLQRQFPVSRLRDPTNRGGSSERRAWIQMAELGFFGLGIAESDGGIGFSIAEEVIVAGSAGSSLLSPSVLATMVAAHFGNVDQYISGSRRAAFANLIAGGRGAQSAEVHLLDAAEADDILVCTPNGIVRLDRLAATDLRQVDGLDETLDLQRATIRLDTDQQGRRVPRCELLLAAYFAGLSKSVVEMAVSYAKEREQFDRPIGEFQAIKHACADMALRTEAAWSQTCLVAATAGNGSPACSGAASARLLAQNAALTNARANIQIHGAMGFTAESEAHYFLKRAHVLSLFGGGKSIVRRVILDRSVAV